MNDENLAQVYEKAQEAVRAVMALFAVLIRAKEERRLELARKAILPEPVFDPEHIRAFWQLFADQGEGTHHDETGIQE